VTLSHPTRMSPLQPLVDRPIQVSADLTMVDTHGRRR
jgi:hypothetical protein